MSDDVYRDLQQHLNELPIGFPPTKSGVEIRILKHLFTPEEAKIGTMLNYATEDLESLESIYERLKSLGYSKEQLEEHLDNMTKKGAITRIVKGSQKTYANAQLMIGIFEYQVNKLTKDFVKDLRAYMKEGWLAESFKVPLPQMRTIPIGITIDHEAAIANYEDIKHIIENSEGPFTIINCVCRQSQDLLGKPCKATSRREVCMGIGGPITQEYINLGWSREITKEEALEILKMNEEEGLVFQPGNAQKVEFICSCCSCCCEGLFLMKRAPNPGELVISNYYAQIDSELCSGCGICIDHCPMDAISPEDVVSLINRKRCIGCGNCVKVCPEEAIQLIVKDRQYIPPETMTELYDNIVSMKNKIIEQEHKRAERKAKRA